MEQHRNASRSSLLSSIMEGTSPAAEAPKNLAAVRSEAAIRKGPRVPRGGGSYGRAVRRQRKAGRVNRTEKVKASTTKLKMERERVLDTAAAFARIWFAGPPAEEPKVGISAYDRVAKRVMKQVDNLLATGRASDRNDAEQQIEDSMRETIRQHDILLADRTIKRLASEHPGKPIKP